MRKRRLTLGLLIGTLFSVTAIAADLGGQTKDTDHRATHRVIVTRGQTMSVDTLSSITNPSSARDQQGKPAKLTEKTYSVASFTRTTITVAPPDGSEDGLITLDLVNH